MNNFVGVHRQAIGVSTLSTKTSHAIKVPNLLTDIGIEFSTTIYLNHFAFEMVARVDAMSRNGQVLSGVVVHAIARPNPNLIVADITASYWLSSVDATRTGIGVLKPDWAVSRAASITC